MQSPVYLKFWQQITVYQGKNAKDTVIPKKYINIQTLWHFRW